MRITVLRGTAELTLSIPAIEVKSGLDSLATSADPIKNLVPELGIIGIEIDKRILELASGLRDPYGVIVAARAAGATTEVPLLPRDVIRTLNNRQMTTLQELRDAVRTLQAGTAVTLQIQREGRLMYVSFTYE